MKKAPRYFWVLLLFAIVVIVLMFTKYTDQKAEQRQLMIQRSVEQELKLHPKATLVDLYKYFFQGAFGPGHLIHDRESALAYLRQELATSTEFDSVKWQPVGYQSAYYRVNLSLVKSGTIALESYFGAFVQSAEDVQPPSPQEWAEEWHFILVTIEQMPIDLPGFADDKSRLAVLLAKGDFAMHHSPIYSESYHPHYRLVNKQYFEKLDIQ